MTSPTGKIKISPSQRLVLQNLADGKKWDAHISGRSAYGGATATMASLTKHGLIQSGQITDAGRRALGQDAVASSASGKNTDMKTLGQIAHEKGEQVAGWSRRWIHMSQGQRDEWEAIALAVAETVKQGAADACRDIGMKHQQVDGAYAAGQKAGAFECAEMLLLPVAAPSS